MAPRNDPRIDNGCHARILNTRSPIFSCMCIARVITAPRGGKNTHVSTHNCPLVTGNEKRLWKVFVEF